MTLFDCQDVISALQNLYFTRFFDIVGYQHSLSLNYHHETTINSIFQSHLCAHDFSTYLHYNLNHHVGVGKLMLIYDIETGDAADFGHGKHVAVWNVVLTLCTQRFYWVVKGNSK